MQHFCNVLYRWVLCKKDEILVSALAMEFRISSTNPSISDMVPKNQEFVAFPETILLTWFNFDLRMDK